MNGRPGIRERDDRILRFTRVVAIVILPFLVVASVLLYGFPTRTDALFAWTIEPPFTAMLLASAYLGGIWFFVRLLLERRWHRIWTGLPAVLVFATIALVATLVHWDRFHAGHISFITWVTVYFAAPVLVAIALIRNARHDPRDRERCDAVIPLAVRLAVGAFGVLALAASAALVLAPNAMAAIWPWPITPLTGRVVGAVLTLPGLVDVLFLVESRWSAFQRVIEAQVASLVFIIAALVICRHDLEWSSPAAWLFSGSLVVALLVYAALLVVASARMRRSAATPEATSNS